LTSSFSNARRAAVTTGPSMLSQWGGIAIILCLILKLNPP
jgi:hypothetical protein